MVKRIHVISESVEDYQNRTVIIEGIYSGLLTFFVVSFLKNFGNQYFSYFQNIENFLGFGVFLFTILLFRSIIKWKLYHRIINTFLLPILTLWIIGISIIMIYMFFNKINFFQLTILFLLILFFGYEINRIYKNTFIWGYFKKYIN